MENFNKGTIGNRHFMDGETGQGAGGGSRGCRGVKGQTPSPACRAHLCAGSAAGSLRREAGMPQKGSSIRTEREAGSGLGIQGIRPRSFGLHVAG